MSGFLFLASCFLTFALIHRRERRDVGTSGVRYARSANALCRSAATDTTLEIPIPRITVSTAV